MACPKLVPDDSVVARDDPAELCASRGSPIREDHFRETAIGGKLPSSWETEPNSRSDRSVWARRPTRRIWRVIVRNPVGGVIPRLG